MALELLGEGVGFGTTSFLPQWAVMPKKWNILSLEKIPKKIQYPDRKGLIKIISTRYFLVIKEINKYLVDMSLINNKKIFPVGTEIKLS
jgi:hypothetical protein